MVSTLLTVVGQPQHADGGRERGFEARHALLALKALEQAGLLAADVGAGAPVDMNVEGVARTAGIGADQPGLAGLLHRRLQNLGLAEEFAANVDVGGDRAHADAGRHATFK